MPKTVSWGMLIKYDVCKICSKLLFWEDKLDICKNCFEKKVKESSECSN